MAIAHFPYSDRRLEKGFLGGLSEFPGGKIESEETVEACIKREILEEIALVIVFVPHYTNEVFMTITNIQWILSILPIILLMKEKPNYRYGNIYVQFAFDFMVIIFCGLTGPFLIFLTPFFAWKWFNNKNLYNFSIVSVAVIVALIQLGFIEFTSTSKLLENPSLALFLKANSAVLGQKFFGGLFLGRIRVYKINPYFLSLLYFCLIFVILRFSLIKNKFVITCLGIQLIIIIVVFYKFRATPEVLIPSGSGMRYFHIPSIMIAWSLIALLEEKEEWKRNLTKMLLILILISSLKSGFHSTKFIDYDWKRYSQLIGKEDVVIPINPKGWEFKLKGHPP